ncbi:helix-turn-helix domain-containing protein [Pseudovibrio ascidiaceicola]|uniref:helix-turn-helix domain-containing protein n=1 Tax=Pseudovibrio ascidiaceicola TaxID=285279 RepID=UPI003D367189
MTRGERIVQKREALNMNRVQLAEKSGVGYDRLNKIEHDKTKDPRGYTLSKIAEALGVSVQYLETGDESQTALGPLNSYDITQSNFEGGNGLLAKQAWEFAEAIEERLYGKHKGGMSFLLETYERILRRLIDERKEKE